MLDDFFDLLIKFCVKCVISGHVGGCGITDSVSQWMDKMQNSALEEEQEKNEDYYNATSKHKTNKLPKKYKKSDKIVDDSNSDKGDSWKGHSSENENPYNKYSREANTDGRASRSKRATRPKEENKNTCSLFIETDPLIWKHITEQVMTCITSIA